MVFILGVGFIVRCLAAFRLPLELDEQNSLLAVRMVAERGIPVLPSGVLYLHGAVLSYLLAPLELLGVGGIDNLFPLRLVSVLAGTATIFLTFRLTRAVAGSVGAALIAAAFIAIDPLSIYWSGHVRMYAFAQAFATTAILFFVGIIMMGPSFDDSARTSRRWLAGLVVAFWLAVFSHLATAALWPAMAVVAALTYGWRLLGRQRAVGVALVACAAAPLLLVLLTTVVGGGAGTRSAAETNWLPGLSFLGDHNIDPTRIFRPSLQGWTELFADGPFAALVPIAIVALSGVLIGRYLLGPGNNEGPGPLQRGVGAIVAVYWIPILGFAFLSPDPEPRYFLFLQPTGFAIVGLGLGVLLESARVRWPVRPTVAAAVAVALLFGIQSVVGTWQVAARTDSQAGDLRPALTFVKERRDDGDLVIVTAAPVSYLLLDDRDALRFLPGDESSQRSQRYAQQSESESQVDYWIGMPAITSVEELCQVLADHPRSWLVAHQRWLERPRIANGPMMDLLRGSSTEEFSEAGGTVFRVGPHERWSDRAMRACESGAQ